MKKVISLIIVLIMLGTSIAAVADEIEFIDVYEIGNIEYYKKDGVLHIQGEGEMPDFKPRYLSDDEGIPVPYYITNHSGKVIIHEGITKIGKALFRGANLTEVTIPESVVKIDEYAFYGCSGLKKVNIEGNNLVIVGSFSFLGCVELEEINLPDSVKYIDSAAFHGCYELNKIVLSDNVEYVFSNAFEYCKSAESLYIGKNMKGYTLNLAGCNNFKTIEVDEGNKFYKAVDNVLFNKDMTELIKFPPKSEVTEYTVPDSVTKIKQIAFDDCDNLRRVKLPEGIEYKNLWAPDTIRFENMAIYKGYKNMEYMGDTIYYTEGESEDGKRFSIHEVRDENGDKAFAIPEYFADYSTASIDMTVYVIDGIESVDASVFDKLPDRIFYESPVKNVILSDNLKVIDQLEFLGCYNLKSINLPEGLERIERCAFSSAGLEEVTIPSSVSYIGEEAFEFCTSLKRIEIKEGNLKTLGNDDWHRLQCFNNIADNAEVYLPGSLEQINDNEFRGFEYGYYGMIGWREYPENMRVYAPRESAAYAWATKNGISVTDEFTENGTGYEDIFEFSRGDGITIKKYIGSDEKVVIPDEIDGVPVTEIDTGAFVRCETIKELIIPKSVQKIDHEAVVECVNLEAIVILNPYVYIESVDLGHVYEEGRPPYTPHGVMMKFPAFMSNGGTVYGYKNSTTEAYFHNFMPLYEEEREVRMIDIDKIAGIIGANLIFQNGGYPDVQIVKDGVTISMRAGETEVTKKNWNGEIIENITWETAVEYKDGKYYVPIEELMEAFGLLGEGSGLMHIETVFDTLGISGSYGSGDNAIEATRGNTHLYFYTGEMRAFVNGETVIWEKAAEGSYPDYYIPVEDVMKAFKLHLEFNPVTNEVEVKEEIL